MPAPDSTLAAIQKKVRRLTRSPSTAQLADADLNEYINTFVVYDFPEHLRTFNLRTDFSFYTNPGQDEYPTDIASYGTAVNNVLYDFQNKYLTVHPPVYVAGYQALYSQSPEQFYGIYPRLVTLLATGSSGNGVTLAFSGTLNTQQVSTTGVQQNIAILQRQVLFESIDVAGIGMAMVDVPVLDNGTNVGLNTQFGNLYNPSSAAYQAALANPPTTVSLTNRINYQTGAYVVTFPFAPAAQQPINAQVVLVGTAQPRALLFYANKFVVRPVPDQVYKINFEVYQRPDYLISTASEPALNEYWQLIAFFAAKKIFEDRLDMDSVAMIMPGLREQLNLCNRRTIVQYTNERTATIYEQQTTNQASFWGAGNQNF